MSFQRFVCPHEPELLSRMDSRVLAVRVDDLSGVASAADDVRSLGNELFCVIVESTVPLDSLTFQEHLRGIPLALRAPGLGKFRNLAGRLELLRTLNVRIFFPAADKDNLSSLRILSSVGVSCGVTFGDGRPDWEALSDLMTYAIRGPITHAPIEPFAFIAQHYHPTKSLDWRAVYFDDPRKFLHLDAQGRVALSHQELTEGGFIANDPAEVEDLAARPAYTERVNAWRQVFLDNHSCARCPGWKVCLGKFMGEGEPPVGCGDFFSEMMEVAEQYQTQQTRQQCGAMWQP